MRKKIWIPIVAFLSFLGGLIFFLPNILSSESCKGMIEKIASKKYGGKVTFEKIELSWTSPLHFSNITYENENDGVTASAEKIVTGGGLLGQHNRMMVDEGKLALPTKEGPSVTFNQISGAFTEKEFTLTGKSTYLDRKGDFDLHIEITQNQVNIAETIKCDGVFDNFPLIALDSHLASRMPKWDGMMIKALGETLEGHFAITYGPDTLECRADLRTPKSSFMLNTLHDGNIIGITPTSKIVWNVDGDIFPYIENAVTLEITGKEIELTIPEKKWSLKSVAGNVVINFTPVDLPEKIHLNGTTITASTRSGDASIIASIGTMISYGKTQGAPFHAALTLDDVFDPLRSIRSHNFFQSLNISTHNFPIALLDTISGHEGALTHYFGSTLDFSFDPHAEDGKEVIDCHLSTPRFTINPMHFEIDELARLTKKVSYQYEPPKKQAASLLNSPFP